MVLPKLRQGGRNPVVPYYNVRKKRIVFFGSLIILLGVAYWPILSIFLVGIGIGGNGNGYILMTTASTTTVDSTQQIIMTSSELEQQQRIPKKVSQRQPTSTVERTKSDSAAMIETTDLASTTITTSSHPSRSHQSSLLKSTIPICTIRQELICSNMSSSSSTSTGHNYNNQQRRRKWKLQMLAIPHTASSGTSSYFKAAINSWKNVINPSLCDNNTTNITTITTPQWSTCVVASANSSTPTSLSQILFQSDCFLNEFSFYQKQHTNYQTMVEKRTSRNNVLPTSSLLLSTFTTLRHPFQLQRSHYRERVTWDSWPFQKYCFRYVITTTTNDGSTNTNNKNNNNNTTNGTKTLLLKEPLSKHPEIQKLAIKEWIEKAWWRHNLMVKTFATNSKVIWVQPTVPFQDNEVTPSQEESELERRLGLDSNWLRLAKERLIGNGIPFFGIQDRMDESYELFEFYTCQFDLKGQFTKPPTTTTTVEGENKDSVRSNKKRKQPRLPIDDEEETLMNKYHSLDLILYNWAVKIFQQRLDNMRRLKQQGWLCDLNPILNTLSVDIDGKNSADRGTSASDSSTTTNTGGTHPFGLRCAG